MFKAIFHVIIVGLVLSSRALFALAAAPASADHVHFARQITFEPNTGQAPAEVSWTARGQGYQIYLTSTGATMVVAEPIELPKGGVRPAGLPQARMTSYRMNLVGSRAWNQIEGQQLTGAVSNYLMGRDPKGWHRNIPQYNRVVVKDVYEGIDLVFYGHDHALEYDFVIRPGSDPNRIRFTFDGTESVRLDQTTGDLVLRTQGGSEMRHVAPKVYQQIGGKKVEIAGSYRITSNGEAAFQLASYDTHAALVVDPTIELTAFLEGSDQDYTTGVAFLGQNTYVVGQTYSTDFPATNWSPYAKSCPGGVCQPYMFVSEISPQGNILASTTVGGTETDSAAGIVVNHDGVWITGTTSSLDFATNNQYARGYWNGFVAKLSLDLKDVAWCTLFGGTGDQYTNQGASAIALGANDAVYVAGTTASTSFPTSQQLTTPHAAKQNTFGGGLQDAFVVKIGSDGSLNSGYSTYLGGSGDDAAFGIAVDKSGHAYVTGYTGSTNFPTNAAKSYGSVANGGTVAFVTELAKDGSSSLYSMMIGGTTGLQHDYPLDQGNAIVLDANNDAYITGNSCSIDFPTNSNSFQKTPAGKCLPQTPGAYYTSAIVAKLGPAGALLYSTYLGSMYGAVTGNSIAVDSAQNVYVAGLTATGDFPGAVPIDVNPSAGFLSKLHPKLYTLESTVFLGATISSIVETEVVTGVTDHGDTYSPYILTAGTRYRFGSPSTASKYLDAFVVGELYEVGP